MQNQEAGPPKKTISRKASPQLFHKDYDDSNSDEVIDHDGTERNIVNIVVQERNGATSARGEQEG